MRMQIHCLMTSSVRMSEKKADMLFEMACLMLRDRLENKYILDEEMAGKITTKFDKHCLGSIEGTKFTAEIETDLGRGMVTYLVRDADVESRSKGVWKIFDQGGFDPSSYGESEKVTH